jgi:hypothetical protein
MPDSVSLSESGGFAVLYFLSEHPGPIEVFWAGNELGAEMEAARLNEIEHLLRAKLGRILTSPESVLDLIERWVTAKRGRIWGKAKQLIFSPMMTAITDRRRLPPRARITCNDGCEPVDKSKRHLSPRR